MTSAGAIEIDWKVGFEIEMMAPRGKSRRDLAERIAQRVGGQSTRFFHPESEPSTVPGRPVFENLTLGFRVEDRAGEWVADLVDDLTLRADFEREAKPQPGWYRIVSDDPRFLRLAERHCDPSDPLEKVLEPLADLFGAVPEMHPEGMVRVSDSDAASIAIGAPLPGERERPCEIVTAPIASGHAATLTALLDDAAALGFALPRESATHIHFDAKPLRSARFVQRFVQLCTRFGGGLKSLLGSNPSCVRLGDWPAKLTDVVARPGFLENTWDETRAVLIGVGLDKYCDFNLVNMVNQDQAKDTLEVRILPGMADAREIVRCAALFEGIVRWCNTDGSPLPETLDALIASLPLAEPEKPYWLVRSEQYQASLSK